MRSPVTSASARHSPMITSLAGGIRTRLSRPAIFPFARSSPSWAISSSGTGGSATGCASAGTAKPRMSQLSRPPTSSATLSRTTTARPGRRARSTARPIGVPASDGGSLKRTEKRSKISPSCSTEPSIRSRSSGFSPSVATFTGDPGGSLTITRATMRWPRAAGKSVPAHSAPSGAAASGTSVAAAARAQAARSAGGARKRSISSGRGRPRWASVRPRTPVAWSTSRASLQSWRSKRTACSWVPCISSHCSSQYSISGV